MTIGTGAGKKGSERSAERTSSASEHRNGEREAGVGALRTTSHGSLRIGPTGWNLMVAQHAARSGTLLLILCLVPSCATVPPPRPLPPPPPEPAETAEAWPRPEVLDLA